jgi:Family of unknown function (DUF6496)
MPEQRTVERAREDLRQGKQPSTAAGEFVRQEIEHVREGKHGARSTKQAIAIGLSEARRAGIPLPPPKTGRTSERTRRAAENALHEGEAHRKPSKTRAAASLKALEREPRDVVSPSALSTQAKRSSRGHKGK